MQTMHTETKKSNFSLFLHELVTAGGAAAISKTAVAPLERVKIILQAQRTLIISEKDKFKGMIDAFARIPKEQGVLAFWRGNGANVVRIIPSIAIRFPSYDTYKRISMPRGEWGYTGAERIVRKMEAAFFAGLTTLAVTYPLDVAKTRLSMDFAKVGEPRNYKGILDCMHKTRKLEGLVVIYRGFWLSVLTNLPYLAVSIGLYDILRDSFIVNRVGEAKKDDAVTNLVRFIGLGTISGFAAQVATYPLDTIRRRVQVNGMLGQEVVYKNALDCVKKMWKEGPQSFYHGLVPSVIKVVPAAAIQFTAYDLLKKHVVEAGLI